MWKKPKLVLLSSVLAISLTYSATNIVALAAEDTTTAVTSNNQYISNSQNYVKVIFDNTVLYHKLVTTKTMIQVFNTKNDVIESVVLSGDKEIVLDRPKIETGEMLSYWSFEEESDKLLIYPIVMDEKDVSARFFSAEGGKILTNNTLSTEVVKSVNKGAYLEDILPEVKPDEHYKFAGWFERVNSEDRKKLTEEEISTLKITDVLNDYRAIFYPDFNDNSIDDRTEEITIKFVTNADKKIGNITAGVGEPIKLPKIEKKNAVFMGWYTDEKYKNQFENDVFTESLTLYAKWEKAEKVIKESQTKPVTDKDISDQIERILKEELRGLNPTTSSNIPVQVPKLEKGINDSIANENNNSKINSFKETKYVYDNKNLGQQYFVKFFGENEYFLFSLTLPYGKTIKIYDENERFRKEYVVRQDTTIILNVEEYVNQGSLLLGFKSREVGVNSTQITEIYPDTKSETNENAARIQKKAMDAMAAEELAAKKQKNLVTWLIAAAAVSFGGAILFLFLKRRKHKKMINEI